MCLGKTTRKSLENRKHPKILRISSTGGMLLKRISSYTLLLKVLLTGNFCMKILVHLLRGVYTGNFLFKAKSTQQEINYQDAFMIILKGLYNYPLIFRRSPSVMLNLKKKMKRKQRNKTNRTTSTQPCKVAKSEKYDCNDCFSVGLVWFVWLGFF